ncbi:ATP-grasp domain-containing protein [Chitinophaga polysaccharea]|uniref:ATP-grasp domain-containing protein n=1 Tax=Chitinophaga polysaccharea TaxID=1293035 RepID=UPI001455757F|nr:ATP-grasp domain-containing protein [Chitinophaga polysaccharea]NLR59148.1 ATP-grasp domain-containing protein [Chitinophaga polysaccharea]
MQTSVTLIIPEKTDIEFEAVLRVWTDNGGAVKRLGRYWVKDEGLTRQNIAIYGNQTFAWVVAQIYGVTLISPDDTLVVELNRRWTCRNITLMQIDEMTAALFPVFIKPVVPKIFMAGIFNTLTDFQQVVNGLPFTEQVMVSDIVDNIQAEARSFVGNGVIRDIALYEGTADITSGEQFLADFLAAHGSQLPATVVIDIAFSEHIGWFILEFNACWGAGLNNCLAEKVIDCIIAATNNDHPAVN